METTQRFQRTASNLLVSALRASSNVRRRSSPIVIWELFQVAVSPVRPAYLGQAPCMSQVALRTFCT